MLWRSTRDFFMTASSLYIEAIINGFYSDPAAPDL